MEPAPPNPKRSFCGAVTALPADASSVSNAPSARACPVSTSAASATAAQAGVFDQVIEPRSAARRRMSANPRPQLFHPRRSAAKFPVPCLNVEVVGGGLGGALHDELVASGGILAHQLVHHAVGFELAVDHDLERA